MTTYTVHALRLGTIRADKSGTVHGFPHGTVLDVPIWTNVRSTLQQLRQLMTRRISLLILFCTLSQPCFRSRRNLTHGPIAQSESFHDSTRSEPGHFIRWAALV